MNPCGSLIMELGQYIGLIMLAAICIIGLMHFVITRSSMRDPDEGNDD